MEKVLTILLAGGAGERLAPLTRDDAKPMMPFGGIYRLIDITLSNCINSGLSRIYVLTQHKALSLNQHIRHTWNILSPELGQFIEVVPPTQRLRNTWYLGTADAVSQNIQSIEEEDSKLVLILSADHVYKMHYGRMLRWHFDQKADITVATTQVPFGAASRFGIVQMDKEFIIQGFEEKPLHKKPARSSFNPDSCSASMGVYLFSTQVLLELLMEDARDETSSHDFGQDVLPKAIGRHRVAAYDFVDENKKDMSYWRDVGTLDAYYDANMDLVAVTPHFNLYDQNWPLRSAPTRFPPAKTVFADEGERMGIAVDSLISHGCIISGGRVTRSILSPGVRINSHSIVEDSILFPGVQVGRHSRIRRAIIDQNILLPENSILGLDPESDQQAGHFVTESGLIIVHRDSPGVTFTSSFPMRRQQIELPEGE
jgi:glucose-1-phosphate adenylyltransferase